MKQKILKKLLPFVFIITQSHAQFTKIHDFITPMINGGQPTGNLFLYGEFLYGVTAWGGTSGDGIIYKIKPDGTGFQKIFDFSSATSGRMAYSTLISDGTYFYGMTNKGGPFDAGTVYKILPDGTGYTKLLDNTLSSSTFGHPWGALLLIDDFLYGMSQNGGNGNGNIFRIKKDGTNYSNLMSFTGVPSPTGCLPSSEFIYDGTYLYGTAQSGGANAKGVLFRIKTDGSDYTKLREFGVVANDGTQPLGALVSDGVFLYGVTANGGINPGSGVIFKIKPDGTEYVKMYDMGGLDGIAPYESLVLLGGYLYGMTIAGGANNNAGTLFRIKTDGTSFAKLLDFSCAEYGCSPRRSLITDGTYLYGTTPSGGLGQGIVFKYLPPSLQVSETDNPCKLTIAPNPSNGIFTISSCNSIYKQLEVYTMLGDKVHQQNNVDQQIILNLSHFSKGMYFIKIIDENEQSITKKILIN